MRVRYSAVPSVDRRGGIDLHQCVQAVFEATPSAMNQSQSSPDDSKIGNCRWMNGKPSRTIDKMLSFIASTGGAFDGNHSRRFQGVFFFSDFLAVNVEDGVFVHKSNIFSLKSSRPNHVPQ